MEPLLQERSFLTEDLAMNNVLCGSCYWAGPNGSPADERSSAGQLASDSLFCLRL